jgi:S-adenosylmethionine-diacylgycerolhomoserine-N-methlytransferase
MPVSWWPMSLANFAADAGILLRMLRGLPRAGSHAERLQGFYAPQAERYDAFRTRLLHGRDALIEALEIPAGARVVELGCGTGSNLAAIDKVRPVVTLTSLQLVDLCPALLAVARQRVLGMANIEVIEADATHWQPAAPVDRVYLSYALTMMPDWRAVLTNAYAMLAPGGRLGLVDFHLPETGGRLSNRFWQTWFAHDGVALSGEHLRTLKTLFPHSTTRECCAAVPYLPGLRAPYYLFVGMKPSILKPDSACTKAVIA